jgi:Flagellar hook-length control protein FliK
MSIQSISAGLTPLSPSTSGRLYLPGAGEFADKLTVGQVIKGRVLRHYEGNRYLVGFDGHERVVDSVVPLKTDELIQGRVLAIGERVELQRIHQLSTDGIADPVSTPPVSREPGLFDKAGQKEQQLNELLVRYQAHLKPADQVQLLKAVRGAQDANAMSLAGLMLNKLGFRQTPELLAVVYAALLRTGQQTGAVATLTELAITSAQGADQQAAAVRGLADALKGAMDEVLLLQQQAPQQDMPQPGGDAPAGISGNLTSAPKQAGLNSDAGDLAKEGGGDLGYRLLNAQTDSTVSHRVGTLPLLLGDQLIEVDVAMFEQRRDAEQKPAARHRHLVFSLNTEALGAVEVSARVVGEHVRIRVLASDSNTADIMAGYVASLRGTLEDGGWVVDEIAYETRTGDTQGGVVRSVVEHVISQDSLNRMI